MYLTTIVTLQDADGNEDDYEVGAEVEPVYLYDGNADRFCGWDVGEPDVSAPGSTLKVSRLARDPQEEGVLAPGWSKEVAEVLIEKAYGKVLIEKAYGTNDW